MREAFPAYRNPSPVQNARLWREGIFVFDASVLLMLYDIDSANRDAFIGTLEKVKDRIWLPYQAGLEFYDNRRRVIERGLRLVADLEKTSGVGPALLGRDAAK